MSHTILSMPRCPRHGVLGGSKCKPQRKADPVRPSRSSLPPSFPSHHFPEWCHERSSLQSAPDSIPLFLKDSLNDSDFFRVRRKPPFLLDLKPNGDILLMILLVQISPATSYVIVRQSRSTTTLSRHAPLPSMLIAIWASCRVMGKATEVNWLSLQGCTRSRGSGRCS